MRLDPPKVEKKVSSSVEWISLEGWGQRGRKRTMQRGRKRMSDGWESRRDRSNSRRETHIHTSGQEGTHLPPFPSQHPRQSQRRRSEANAGVWRSYLCLWETGRPWARRRIWRILVLLLFSISRDWSQPNRRRGIFVEAEHKVNIDAVSRCADSRIAVLSSPVTFEASYNHNPWTQLSASSAGVFCSSYSYYSWLEPVCLTSNVTLCKCNNYVKAGLSCPSFGCKLASWVALFCKFHSRPLKRFKR